MLLHNTRRCRRGFTLIEILVVIAIIAVLAALSVGGAFTVIDSTRSSRTEDAVRKIDKILHAQWNKVIEEARAEPDMSPAVMKFANDNTERARVIWIKLRLMEAFPQRFAEMNAATNPLYLNDGPVAQGFSGTPWIPAGQRKYIAEYQTALAGMNAGAHQAATESAACLYLALIKERGVLKLSPDQFTTNIGDTDKDNIKELIDNWGNPLTFRRFPANDTNLNALNPNKKNVKGQRYGDPLDPEGTLQQPPMGSNLPWFQVRNPNVGAVPTNAIKFNNIIGHTVGATSPYMIPIIISNGRDGKAGTNDDMFSYYLRVGAKG